MNLNQIIFKYFFNKLSHIWNLEYLYVAYCLIRAASPGAAKTPISGYSEGHSAIYCKFEKNTVVTRKTR